MTPTLFARLATAIRAILFNITHPHRMPQCRHGFAPDQGLGLWCPACR